MDNTPQTITLGELIDKGSITITHGFACGDHNSSGEGVLHVRPFNVSALAEIVLDQQKHVPSSIVTGRPTLNLGDILFNNTNTKELVGKTALWNGPANSVFSNHMTRIRVCDATIPPQFLADAIHAHWISGRSQMLARSHVAQASILGERFREIEIPWPDTVARESFAEALDAMHKCMGTEAQIAKITNELKHAAMRALFTHGLQGEAQKETEIGVMPHSWHPRTILELCEIRSGGTPRRSVGSYWGGDIPWVSGKDLKRPTLDDTSEHLTSEGVDAGSRIVPADSVLILVRGMGLAKDLPVAVINQPMAFNQDVKALELRGTNSGRLLRSAIYFSKPRLLSQIVPSAHGTMTLNLNDIETFQIPWPSDPDEAEGIADCLEAIEQKFELHRRKQGVLNELFQSLLHKLMTGEIRGADLDMAALVSSAPAEVTA